MENLGIVGYTLGFYRDNGKENGNYDLGDGRGPCSKVEAMACSTGS